MLNVFIIFLLLIKDTSTNANIKPTLFTIQNHKLNEKHRLL
ncbi:hypothetical protein P20480_1330 [Pseudoalteromonas sp. BSi20480]|nr:hypothetical protein P20480_1330 [Pseudoalteromonas sp. BSi20480]